ncbi:Rpn family recombination-promoting nuclease/putative transposase [Spirulina sp. 06S082]|uniref:Rpn family recombination-promoting nuclease/putative transposase n=1 Tax=Spirulina sp. 06S082 TaxID=3110248 RepID=UPI002B21D347|nr:Rpn family recombination-promoting nuclease/putative transposase [Spirulina sp. 06S082]MEA5469357.1 Rpn family recombination-promoting nuclease/putative transposase [Spirulina sp. 06S082]
MKTDSIFYQLFQSFPDVVFELINLPSEAANAYQFSSVEVKQTAFRIDGVLLPSTPELPIYFVEVQFQPDAQFYTRFFTEIFLYLSKTELANNWRGVIIYPRRSVDTGSTERYKELLNSRRVSRIYLNELAENTSIGLSLLQLIIADETEAIPQGRELIERANLEFENARQQQNVLKLIETILVYKLPRSRREEIEAMFSLSDLRETRVYQDALEEGRAEGRAEGQILAKLELVPFLVSLGVSPEEIAQRLDLTIEQVISMNNEQ